MSTLTVAALCGIGEIEPGADLTRELGRALVALGTPVGAGNVLVVAQKIVSKAEGRIVVLDEIVPSVRAQELAAATGKSAALVELVLRESSEVLRACPDVLIVRHRLGYVLANAGVDQSNVRSVEGRETCLLLPADPQGSAHRLHQGLAAYLNVNAAPAVIISDSFGRPWRRGVVNVAIGSAGLPALIDRRGELDRYGRPMQVTQFALADALAAAAGIVMGECSEGIPAVLISGVAWSARDVGAPELIRPIEEDLFR